MQTTLTVLLFDFSYVLLFPIDTSYKGTLTHMYELLRGIPVMEHIRLNQGLLETLMGIKNRFTLGIFTAGKMHQAPEIRSILDNTFQQYFTEDEVGFGKNNPRAFKEVAKRLSVKPEQILFVDDRQQNVAAAQRAGLTAVQYTTNEKLFEAFRKLDIV